MVAKGEPEEILDEAHEQLLHRVCAIDVAKDSGKVCLRVPAETGTGRRVSRVWDVPARTKAVIELADHLVCQGVEKVTVESTSDYWRIWFYLLEAAGLDVQLVNARDVKNVPGRPKTDKLDAVWLAKLTEKGLLRPSFVPPRADPGAAGLHPAAGGPDRRTGAALGTAGEAAGRRPDQGLGGGLPHRHGVGAGHDRSTDRRAAQPTGAGRSGPGPDEAQAHRPGAGPDRPVRRPPRRAGPHLLEQIDALTAQIDTLTARIDALLAAMPVPPGPHGPGPGGGTTEPNEPPPAVPLDSPDPSAPTPPPPVRTAAELIDILDEIPGIGRHVAQVIIAEIGLDMSRFPTAGHLVSWAKLCPRTIQSGAKTAAGKTGKGNRYLKAVLGDAAAGAGKTNTFLGERYRRIVKRRGKLKALVAVARSTLVIVWHLLSNPGTALPRPRFGLLHQPHRPRTPNPQPRPSTPSARLPGHPQRRRLT